MGLPAWAVDHEFWLTGVGSVILYVRWSATGELHAIGLESVLTKFGLAGRSLSAVELLLFVTLGTVVGYSMTSPVNPAQALAAGFGWTAAFSQAPRVTAGAPRKKSP